MSASAPCFSKFLNILYAERDHARDRSSFTPMQKKKQSYICIFWSLYLLTVKGKANYSGPDGIRHSLSSVCLQFRNKCNCDLLRVVSKYSNCATLSKDLLGIYIYNILFKDMEIDFGFFNLLLLLFSSSYDTSALFLTMASPVSFTSSRFFSNCDTRNITGTQPLFTGTWP